MSKSYCRVRIRGTIKYHSGVQYIKFDGPGGPYEVQCKLSHLPERLENDGDKVLAVGTIVPNDANDDVMIFGRIKRFLK